VLAVPDADGLGARDLDLSTMQVQVGLLRGGAAELLRGSRP